MSSFNLKKIEKELKEKKILLEKELEKFATKNGNLKGDWDTKFPNFDRETTSQALEEAADEVEEYVTNLPIEHSLEIRLRDIDLALQKIKKGKYGKCEKCSKPIPKERLKAFPEARFCLKCRD